jgi:hypothetical protein
MSIPCKSVSVRQLITMECKDSYRELDLLRSDNGCLCFKLTEKQVVWIDTEAKCVIIGRTEATKQGRAEAERTGIVLAESDLIQLRSYMEDGTFEQMVYDALDKGPQTQYILNPNVTVTDLTCFKEAPYGRMVRLEQDVLHSNRKIVMGARTFVSLYKEISRHLPKLRKL